LHSFNFISAKDNFNFHMVSICYQHLTDAKMIRTTFLRFSDYM